MCVRVFIDIKIECLSFIKIEEILTESKWRKGKGNSGRRKKQKSYLRRRKPNRPKHRGRKKHRNGSSKQKWSFIVEMERREEREKLLKASQKPRHGKTKCPVVEHAHVQPIRTWHVATKHAASSRRIKCDKNKILGVTFDKGQPFTFLRPSKQLMTTTE